MDKKNVGWMVLLFVSFVIRIIYVNDGLFHHDSVQLANAVEATLESGVVHPAVGGKYFLVVVYTLFHLLLGQSAYISMTFLTIIFATAAVLMVYFFTKELTSNEVIAFSAAILYSFNPLFLSITTYAKSHALAVFLVMLAGYFLIRGLKTDKTMFFVGFGLTMVCALMTRVGTVFFLPVFILMVLQPEKIIKDIKTPFSWMKRSFCMVFTVIGIFLLYKLKLIYYYSMDVPTLGFGRSLYILFGSFNSLLDALTLPVFVGLVFIIYYMLYKKMDWELGFLAFWFFATFFPLAVSSTVSPRYWSNSLIPLMILAGYGIYFVSVKYRKTSVAVLILLLIISLGFIIPIIGFRSIYCGPMEMSFVVGENSAPGDVIAINGDYHPHIEYYAGRKAVLIRDWDRADYVVVWKEGDIALVNEYDNTYFVERGKHKFSYLGSVMMEDFHKSSLELKLREVDMYGVLK